MEPHSGGDRPELPRPTLWPVGFAIGVVCILVGLVVSWPAVAVGGAIAIIFGFFWVRDLAARRAHPSAPAEPAPAAPPAAEAPAGERYPRSRFLEGATLGLGAVVGGVVSAPAIGFAIIPPFLKQSRKAIDLGPISDYPEGKWLTVQFFLDRKESDVSRRTAYIRYNGLLGKLPSFTILSNRCAHLGCPVQPLGIPQPDQSTDVKTSGADVTLTPVLGVSGFACPCHGGAYDTEGDRTAGPPVRGLDRYEFSIRKGRLYLGKTFSVKSVVGSGAQARIHRYDLAGPGQHVGDWESWLYPVQPPS